MIFERGVVGGSGVVGGGGGCWPSLGLRLLIAAIMK
jgi:hypothetical protein